MVTWLNECFLWVLWTGEYIFDGNIPGTNEQFCLWRAKLMDVSLNPVVLVHTAIDHKI